MTPHAKSSEPTALAFSVEQPVEAVSSSVSGSDLIPQSHPPFAVPPAALNLYSIVQQEVLFGVQALQRESADIAVTMFQSALQKLTVDQPLYDHLVHNLLASYRLLIEQLLRSGKKSLALDFLSAALRLEISGQMAGDTTFRRKFSGVFQDLGIVL